MTYNRSNWYWVISSVECEWGKQLISNTAVELPNVSNKKCRKKCSLIRTVLISFNLNYIWKIHDNKGKIFSFCLSEVKKGAERFCFTFRFRYLHKWNLTIANHENFAENFIHHTTYRFCNLLLLIQWKVMTSITTSTKKKPILQEKNPSIWASY